MLVKLHAKRFIASLRIQFKPPEPSKPRDRCFANPALGKVRYNPK